MPEPGAVCTRPPLQHGPGGLYLAAQGQRLVPGSCVMSLEGRELPVCHHSSRVLFVALDLHLAAPPSPGEEDGNKDGLDSGSPPGPHAMRGIPLPGPAPRLRRADTHLHQVDSEGLFPAAGAVQSGGDSRPGVRRAAGASFISASCRRGVKCCVGRLAALNGRLVHPHLSPSL